MLRDRRLMALFGVSLLLTLLILFAYAFGALRSLEFSSVDRRFQLRGATNASKPKDVVIVKIDDKSFSDLNLQWPFPRGAHAAMIDRLSKDGAKVIVFDVQFTEPSEDVEQDNELIVSIARAGNVVLATSEADNGRTRVLGDDRNVRLAHATVGNALLPFDTGSVIRRLEPSRGGIPSLAVAAVERATEIPIERSKFGSHGSAWIDFSGPPGTVKSVSYSDVLNDKISPRVFKDKIVVVGAATPTLHDLHRTSTSGPGQMDGVEIQANAIGTIQNDFPLTGANWPFNVMLIILLGLVTPLASLKFAPRGAFAIAFTTAVIFTITTIVGFYMGLIWAYVYPMLALVLSAIASLGVNFVSASYERERVRDIFSRFVSDSVVEAVLEESGGVGAKLGGKRVETTVMFTDLRSFTTFAEKLAPERVIEVLNRYLTEMSDSILDEQGTLVSYMGDGIMAVFGAPLESKDHADRALAAGRNMLERMHGFNEWMAEQGLGHGFKMGIGLNTGFVMSGNVGSERRLEYTAIGDTTNTASRLEGHTKGTDFQLYMAESTYEALKDAHEDLVYVDELPIRGREEGLRVWGLVERDPAYTKEKSAQS